MKSHSSRCVAFNNPAHRSRAFTLVELMVATVLLLLLMLVTVTVINTVSKIDARARAKVDTFREARAGFELMTRRVSTAMLNTYWDYYDAGGYTRANTPTPPPFIAATYGRQSELHFVAGPAKLGAAPLLPDATMAVASVTHSLFFQSPQGFTTDPSPAFGASASLPSLLNASGYFIEYTSDKDDRPLFLQKATPAPAERWRFRLMEFNQGSEYFQVYRQTSGGTSATAPLDWFRLPIKDRGPTVTPVVTRVLAENVIALFVLPHRSPNDTPLDGTAAAAQLQLAPNYYYDSREYISAPKGALPLLTRNQLPPMVQVTMVVIDERSAQRLQSLLGATPQLIATATDKLGLTGGTPPFVKASTSSVGTNFNDLYKTDLAALEVKLRDLRLDYRVFTTDVSILQAKWSE